MTPSTAIVKCEALDIAFLKSFGKWVGFSVGASPTPPFPTPVGMLYTIEQLHDGWEEKTAKLGRDKQLAAYAASGPSQ
jgi:hypothetical protein